MKNRLFIPAHAMGVPLTDDRIDVESIFVVFKGSIMSTDPYFMLRMPRDYKEPHNYAFGGTGSYFINAVISEFESAEEARAMVALLNTGES